MDALTQGRWQRMSLRIVQPDRIRQLDQRHIDRIQAGARHQADVKLRHAVVQRG